MNIPGFAAEASLYKTGQTYCGYSGMPRTDIASVQAAQISCQAESETLRYPNHRSYISMSRRKGENP